MSEYGFVYIWYDRKYKRYYVGSHWGKEDDGYICSSNWMRMSYSRRPEDFKRRVISRVHTNRKDLLIEETRWLLMIKPEEVKVRYYNINILGNSKHWIGDEQKYLSVSEKISRTLKAKGTKMTPEQIAQRTAKILGRKNTDETKAKMSAAAKGKVKSEEHKRKLAEAQLGRTYSPEVNAKKALKYTDEMRTEKSRRMKQFWADRKLTLQEGEPLRNRK